MKRISIVGGLLFSMFVSGCGLSGPKPTSEVPQDKNETIHKPQPSTLVLAIEKLIGEQDSINNRLDSLNSSYDFYKKAYIDKEIEGLKNQIMALQKENGERKKDIEAVNANIAAKIEAEAKSEKETLDEKEYVLALTPCQVGKKCYVTTYFANVRATPSDKASIVRVHEKNDLVEVFEEKDHFFKTKNGWIRDYILKAVSYKPKNQGANKDDE